MQNRLISAALSASHAQNTASLINVCTAVTGEVCVSLLSLTFSLPVQLALCSFRPTVITVTGCVEGNLWLLTTAHLTAFLERVIIADYLRTALYSEQTLDSQS